MNADEVAALVGGDVKWYPAPDDGCIARAAIRVEGRVIAAVSETDVVFATAEGLRGFQRLADAMGVQAIVGLTALDAGFTLLDALGPAYSTLFYGVWDPPRERGSGVSLCLGDWHGVVWAAHLADGVELTGPADDFGRPRPTWIVRSDDELRAAVADVTASVRRALEARAAFEQRAPTAASVAEELRKAIRKAKAARGMLRVDTRGAFPDQRPSATIWRFDDLGQHHVVEVAETASGITVDGKPFAGVDEVVALVAADRDRLTGDKLVPGAEYRVLRPFLGRAAGTSLRFREALYLPREGITLYRFDGLDLADDHEVMLKLEEFLTR